MKRRPFDLRNGQVLFCPGKTRQSANHTLGSVDCFRQSVDRTLGSVDCFVVSFDVRNGVIIQIDRGDGSWRIN